MLQIYSLKGSDNTIKGTQNVYCTWLQLGHGWDRVHKLTYKFKIRYFLDTFGYCSN